MVELAIENAARGTSSCRGCKEKILKGEVRWAKSSESERFGTVKAFFHLQHLNMRKGTASAIEFDKIKKPKNLSEENLAIAKDKLEDLKSGASIKRKASSTKSEDNKKSKTEDIDSGDVEWKYKNITVSRLKDYLRANKQHITGKKAELIERCIDGQTYGALPLCPLCGEGKLKLSGLNAICAGYFDEDCGLRINCSFVEEKAKIEREPWLEPDDVDHDSPAIDTKKEKANSKSINKISSKVKEFVAKDSSKGIDSMKDLANILGNFGKEELELNLPADESACRQKIGSLLIQFDIDTESSLTDQEEKIISLFAELSKSIDAKSAKLAPKQEVKSKNKLNGKIASMLDELAMLTGKAGGSGFKVRGLKTAALALRNLDYQVTDGVSLSKGKGKVAGIGKSTANKIDQFLDTGTMEELEKLREEMDKE